MRVQRLLSSLAFLAVGYTLGSVLLATVVSPAFSWRYNALSNLGVTTTDAGTTATVVIFNGGLVGGGLAGMLFCVLAFRLTRRPGRRIVVTMVGVTLVMMSLVGVFPQGTAPHFPVAAAFFLLVTLTTWVAAVVCASVGDRHLSLLSFAAGTANILTWVVWFVAAPIPEALAIPEMVGATLFGGWLCAYAVRITPE